MLPSLCTVERRRQAVPTNLRSFSNSRSKGANNRRLPFERWLSFENAQLQSLIHAPIDLQHRWQLELQAPRRPRTNKEMRERDTCICGAKFAPGRSQVMTPHPSGELVLLASTPTT